MKKIYLALLSFSISTLSFAQDQLPNSGFEFWETIDDGSASYEAPSPWEPGSFCVDFGTTTCAVSGTKTTDANTGSYAIKINSEESLGLILLSDYDASEINRPNSFEVFVKTDLNGGDSLQISIFFYNGSLFDDEPEVVGVGQIIETNDMLSYTKLTGVINYTSVAGYEYVAVIAAITNENGTNSSLVYVDDFKLNYGALGLGSSMKDELLSSTLVNNSLTFNQSITSFEIINQTGQAVLNGTTQEVDLTGINSGIYFMKIIKENGELVSYRIVKQ